MVAFSAKRQLGNKGEDIACVYLQSKGFEIVERNYLKPWGEIDIIARKGKALHFIEVKTISRATSAGGGSRGTSPNMTAEDQLHPAKLKRLARTVDIYMGDRDSSVDYQIDLVTVELDMKTRTARCKLYEQVL
ncbi:MAG: YraN family protein [Candidatus Pacebacteria bacterium]|nr:YraN family protein [Candidatus Paceibacterota bacterium]